MSASHPYIQVNPGRREQRVFPMPRTSATSPTMESNSSSYFSPCIPKYFQVPGRIREVRSLFRNPLVLFGVAQIFVVWIVVTSMVYLQDFALKGPANLFANGTVPECKTTELESKKGLEVDGDSDGSVIMRSPSCRLRKGNSPEFVKRHFPGPPNSTELPLLIFFAGVEGSGHKFFEQVLRNLPVNFTIVKFEPDLHLTVNENQTNVPPTKAKKFAHCFKLPYAKPLDRFTLEVQKRLQESQNGPYVRSRDSYPLGRVRTPLARPDLINMIHLDGILYRLKVVVLLRNLENAVRSVWRVGYHGGDTELQARIVEDSMNHLDTVIRMLKCDQYIVMNFDWIADEPKVTNPLSYLQAASSALANFLGLNMTAEIVMEAVKRARKSRPVHKATVPPFGNSTMAEFFLLRSEMWPLLAAARNSPYFWPSNPADWPEKTEV